MTVTVEEMELNPEMDISICSGIGEAHESIRMVTAEIDARRHRYLVFVQESPAEIFSFNAGPGYVDIEVKSTIRQEGNLEAE